MTPRNRFLDANRLRQHLLEWGSSGETVLLLHGFLEHAHVWDFVAPKLALGGFHVFALDWRGHGDSDWVGPGGYYHFADYVADLGFIVRALGGRASLVGHSMGGSAAVLYAGTEPDRVTRLVCVEGLGPPDAPLHTAPDRYAAWIGDLEQSAKRAPRQLDSLDTAAERLRERFPRFSDAVAKHMAEFATRQSERGWTWKFDPLHQTSSPQSFSAQQARAFWQRVACPVLFVEGDSSDVRSFVPDLDERLAVLRAGHVTIPDCGHHPHLEHPAELAAILVDFLASPRWRARNAR